MVPDGSERVMLEQWVDYYRDRLRAKCQGLTGTQLALRSCEPSAMSLAGLVRHMTEMERVYAHRLADRTTGFLYCTDEDPEGDFASATADTAATDLVVWAEHCEKSRRIMAPHELDDMFGRTQRRSLRWFYLYLIKEYSRHLGHADLLRERIDGATGE
jgi:short subunit dehydrogenase-like uncharacterized protein